MSKIPQRTADRGDDSGGYEPPPWPRMLPVDLRDRGRLPRSDEYRYWLDHPDAARRDLDEALGVDSPADVLPEAVDDHTVCVP